MPRKAGKAGHGALTRPRTRPSPYDKQALAAVCDRLAAGENIRKICADETMPAVATLYEAMFRDEAIRNEIARAREAQQDAIIDEIITMADKATVEDHQVVKLRIWARQWQAAKLAPKKYGEAVRVDGTVNVAFTDIVAQAAALRRNGGGEAPE